MYDERAKYLYGNSGLVVFRGALLKIRWHGHSCFEVSDETQDLTVVTDPHDGKYLGIKPPAVKADIILISHGHFDHNSAKTVAKKDSKIVDRPGSVKVREVKIRGLQVFHDSVQGQSRGENIIFRFSLSDMEFCHLGDLGHLLDEKTARSLTPIDFLFVPVGGVFTIDATQAWKVIRSLSPRVIIPMHYKTGGLSLAIQPIDQFLQLAGDVPIMKIGNENDFDASDIPGSMTVWEFSQ